MLSPSPHHSPSPRHANILLPLALPKESQDLSSTHRPTTSASASALPALTPFFTLVESTHDPSPHHPTTHYLFSDDDPDLITDAALLIHEPPPTTKSTPGINNRYILVTLAPDARSIVSAQSMTGDWQVLSADIRAAPTLEGEGEEGTLAPSLVDLDALSGGKHVECVKIAALVSECFYSWN